MRDPKLMLSLLEEMSERASGTLPVFKPGDGYTGESHRRHHHAELLVDANHAEWGGRWPPSCPHHQRRLRLPQRGGGGGGGGGASNPATGKRATSKFIELFNNGVAYARAAQSAVDLVNKMGASVHGVHA